MYITLIIYSFGLGGGNYINTLLARGMTAGGGVQQEEGEQQGQGGRLLALCNSACISALSPLAPAYVCVTVPCTLYCYLPPLPASPAHCCSPSCHITSPSRRDGDGHSIINVFALAFLAVKYILFN
jgi:hypothetical protein